MPGGVMVTPRTLTPLIQVRSLARQHSRATVTRHKLVKNSPGKLKYGKS